MHKDVRVLLVLSLGIYILFGSLFSGCMITSATGYRS